MAGSPKTRPSLLVRIRNSGDGLAWGEFVDIYAPLIYGFARRCGLQDADAADLTQEVLCAINDRVKKLDYDPQRGSFRGWLFTVVRNKLRNLVQRRRRPGRGSADTGTQKLLESEPARNDDAASQWDELYEQRLFNCAAEKVRGKVEASTWEAFWQTAVKGKRAKQVAEALEISSAAVYLAKSRVMNRLKEQIRYMRAD